MKEGKVQMTVFDIWKSLKKGDIHPVYCLYGKETYLLQETVQRIRQAVVDEETKDFSPMPLLPDQIRKGWNPSSLRQQRLVWSFEPSPAEDTSLSRINNKQDEYIFILFIVYTEKRRIFCRRRFKGSDKPLLTKRRRISTFPYLIWKKRHWTLLLKMLKLFRLWGISVLLLRKGWQAPPPLLVLWASPLILQAQW